MQRQRVASGGPWEARVGYSRAIRVGPRIYVAGTTSVGPDGTVRGVGSLETQSREAFATIERALRAAGAQLSDVVRTRAFVTDISRWEEYGRVHGELFGAVRPASTLVEVPRLLHPDMLVEVEVDAEVGPRRPTRRRPGARGRASSSRSRRR